MSTAAVAVAVAMAATTPLDLAGVAWRQASQSVPLLALPRISAYAAPPPTYPPGYVTPPPY